MYKKYTKVIEWCERTTNIIERRKSIRREYDKINSYIRFNTVQLGMSAIHPSEILHTFWLKLHSRRNFSILFFYYSFFFSSFARGIFFIPYLSSRGRKKEQHEHGEGKKRNRERARE